MISLALIMLVAAQDTPAPTPTATPPAKSKKVCRDLPPAATGSHLDNMRACKTPEQWARFDRQNGTVNTDDIDGARAVHN